ncbi:hypothetical protein M595_0351 [Lyngbya aestuarii BL J]|uniref:Uncharacterized protein n=1 Tax=Lyngbya aestuarii BL J TaxID=1348334 RepID=U7QQZ1_9CYAN|nr:hypothetical protein M595_0351 [Lyngbya aestuarii BL J]
MKNLDQSNFCLNRKILLFPDPELRKLTLKIPPSNPDRDQSSDE